MRSPTISSNTVASREVGICNQVDLVCCRPKRSLQFFDPTRSKFRKLKKPPELDANLSPFGLHRLRFASSRKVEIHWSMRAVTKINLRFVSGSGDRDRCEFREWLCCSGCIDFSSLRLSGTRRGETDRRQLTRVVIPIFEAFHDPLIESDQDDALSTSLSTNDKTSFVVLAQSKLQRGSRPVRVGQGPAAQETTLPAQILKAKPAA